MSAAATPIARWGDDSIMKDAATLLLPAEASPRAVLALAAARLDDVLTLTRIAARQPTGDDMQELGEVLVGPLSELAQLLAAALDRIDPTGGSR